MVVGLGRSGLASVKYLTGQGAKVTVTDSNANAETPHGVAASYFGSNPPEIFAEQDMIVLSPGVPNDIEGVKLAGQNNIPVVCELELGLKMLNGKVIGITGTNGKSTTTKLVGEILKEAGNNVWVGGNIGRPLIDDIDIAKDAKYVVLELSSYQLELTPSLKPFIAIWLNVTPDHLDRYETFDHYIKAKTKIGTNQDGSDWIVFNSDDQIVSREIESFRSKKVPFSVSRELKSGGWYEESIFKSSIRELSVDINSAKIKGIHNRENIAAASLTAAICSVGSKTVEDVLKRFEGLPHRLQFVRELNGVTYFNDSKGTNIGAVIRSVESFDSPVLLIAGGQDKNTGYEELRGVVKEKVKMILAIGEAAQNICSELGDVTTVEICETMQDAVRKAETNAENGDVVLLSPACASFDMYKDYTKRGEDFTKCVNKL